MRDVKKIEFILLGIMIFVFVFMSFLSKQFLNVSTLLQIMQLSAELGIMAIPMTLIVITGGIDLSMASTLALSGVIMGYLWLLGLNIWFAAVLAIAFAGMAGLFNAVMITKFDIPPLLATLGTWALYRGIATGIDQGRGVSGFPQGFLSLGEGSLMGIPYSLLIWAAISIVIYFIVTKTGFGRYLFAIGSNETGAIYSGVPVKKIKIIIYVLAGLLAGLAAVIYTSRVGAAKSNADANGVLGIVAAAVLGGADVKGGSGTILGTAIAVLIIAFIDSGLTLANVQQTVQEVILGIILVGSIIFYEYVGKSKMHYKSLLSSESSEKDSSDSSLSTKEASNSHRS